MKQMEATDVSRIPELVRLAERVKATGQPQSLRVASEEVGVLMPPRRARRRRATKTRRSRYLRADDTFWNIVGMHAGPEGTTDVSSDKHRYLADAYAPKGQ